MGRFTIEMQPVNAKTVTRSSTNKCDWCGDTGIVVDTDGVEWPCMYGCKPRSMIYFAAPAPDAGRKEEE